MSTLELTQLLDPEQVTRFLRAVAELLSLDLWVVDSRGERVAEAGLPHASKTPGADAATVTTHPSSALPEPSSGEAQAPIEIHGESIGYVIARPANGMPPARLAAATELVAQILADQAYKEHELHSLSTELINKYEEITLLYDVSQALGSVFDIPTICEIALEKAVQAVPAAKAFVMLKDQDSGHLTVVAARVDGLLGRKVPIGLGVSGKAAATGKPILLYQGQVLESKAPQGNVPRDAVLSVPMIRTTDQGTEEVLGVITLAGKPPGEMFTAGDLKLLTTIATQTAIAIHNSRMIEALREAERVRQELEIAARIQQSLLPHQAPRVPGVELAARCVPATNVGGDYYDFVTDSTGRLTLLIADVSGHSVGAALMMAMARSVLRREIAEGKSPAAVLSDTNAAMLHDLSNADLFITMFCARYDPETRQLTFANGGHNPPLLWCAAEERIVDLDGDGLIIGVLEDVAYEEKSISLHPGDVLALYTDGIVEARNPQGEFFGVERLRQLLRKHAAAAPTVLVEYIHQAVRQHIQDTPQQDDITLLILKAQEAPGPAAPI